MFFILINLLLPFFIQGFLDCALKVVLKVHAY